MMLVWYYRIQHREYSLTIFVYCLFLTVLSLLCSAQASHCGAQAVGMWASVLAAQDSRAQAQQLRLMDSVASQLVESSGTRDQTHVPWIGCQTLNHCITREVQSYSSLYPQISVPFYFLQLSFLIKMWDRIISKENMQLWRAYVSFRSGILVETVILSSGYIDSSF